MNANYPAQCKDARPALLLLAAAALLLASVFIAQGFAHLATLDIDAIAISLKPSQNGPAFQAIRPPEPPTGGGRPLVATATPTPSPAVSSALSPLPTALPVATPPASQ